MSRPPVNPSTRLASFSCPHCGAHAHQSWFEVHARALDRDELPSRPDLGQFERNIPAGMPSASVEHVRRYLTRLLNGEVFLEKSSRELYKAPKLENVFVSLCYSCEQPSVWVHDQVIHPPLAAAGIEPNDDLSADIKRDFKEAGNILTASPRGAAALLRLCIQKLCMELDESGEDLNAAIGSLVRKGMSAHVQQALDIVRVVGNHAVHPGQIDLRDDRDTALQLFDLVNEIAEDRITRPTRVKKLYDKIVPESTRKAIEKRDGKT